MDDATGSGNHRLRLDGAGGAEPIGPDEDSGNSWTHYRWRGEDESAFAELAQVEPQIAEALIVESARPRFQAHRGGILVVMRGINQNRDAEPEDMVSVRCWVQGRRIVTVSPRCVAAVAGVHAELLAGDGPSDSAGVLAALADALADRIAPTIDQLDDHIEALQVELLAPEDDCEDVQRRVADTRRVVAQLRRHLAPQRDAFTHLQRNAVAPLQPDHVAILREVADRMHRYVEDLDSIRERAVVLQDEIKHAATMVLNRNTYLLSIVAAIFLPLSLLTGLLGINVGGIPGAQSPAGFWVVVAALVLLAGFEWWLLRRLRAF